jgi:hypothetical protein
MALAAFPPSGLPRSTRPRITQDAGTRRSWCLRVRTNPTWTAHRKRGKKLKNQEPKIEEQRTAKHETYGPFSSVRASTRPASVARRVCACLCNLSHSNGNPSRRRRIISATSGWMGSMMPLWSMTGERSRLRPFLASLLATFSSSSLLAILSASWARS